MMCDLSVTILALAMGAMTVPGGSAETVDLVRDGRATATIVVPDHPIALAGPLGRPRQTQTDAAEELQRWIRKATGAELPIVAVRDAPETGTLLFVGRSRLTDDLGVQTPAQPEGVVIQSVPRGIALVGEIAPAGTNLQEAPYDRGTMHAVQTFLEDHVGFRFYFDAANERLALSEEVAGIEDFGVVVPYGPDLAVTIPISRREAPAFAMRDPGGGWHDLRMSSRSGSANLFYAMHSHNGWKYHFRKEHPEYFLLTQDGSRNVDFLCYAEPGVLHQEVQNLVDHFAGRKYRSWHAPRGRYIVVEPADNLPDCQCRRCQAALRDGHHWGRQSDLWFGYVRRLAIEVKQRWPEMRIATLAYQWHTLPPTFELPDNVDVMLCLLAPTQLYKEPEIQEQHRKLVSDWFETLGGRRDRLYIYDYPCWPGFWTAAPYLYPHLKQRWLHELGGYTSGQHLCPVSKHNLVQWQHVMQKITMKLLWNPDLDVDAYLRDYCEHFFGPAAGPMERFYKLLIERWEQTVWTQQAEAYDAGLHSGILGETYPPEVIHRLDAYLKQAEIASRPGSQRPRSLSAGDWWMTDAATIDRAGAMEWIGDGKPVVNPALTWPGGRLQYRGMLHRGLRLRIEPGPKATLHAVDMVPPDAGKARFAGSSGYRVGNIWIRQYADPEMEYRVTLAGTASEDATPKAGIYFATKGPSFWFAWNKLGVEETVITRRFSPPPEHPAINRIDFFRHNREGTVAFYDVSIKPDLPPEGVDVTDRIDGDWPRPDSSRHLTLHFAADAETEGTLSMTWSSDVRGVAAPHRPASLYHKRVKWMASACRDFNAETRPYGRKSGFFVEARQAHRWIRRVPEIRVRRLDRRPDLDLSSSVWRSVPSVFLVRGFPDARTPVDRLGFPAERPTRIQMLQDPDNVYIAFECSQSELPDHADSVDVALFGRDGRDQILSVTCTPDGALTPADTGVSAVTALTEGAWTAVLAIPRARLDGDGPVLRASITRRHGDSRYLLSPRLDGLWGGFPPERRARIILAE